MAGIPLVALQTGRGSTQYPPEYATPMGQLGQIIGVQKGMLDMQRQQQTLQAQQQAAQIMATSPPDQMSGNLAKSGVYAWVPDVGNMITNRDNALSEINQRSTIQSTNASQAYFKAMAAYAMTEHPTQEGAEAIRRAYADNIADPAARTNFLRNSVDADESLFNGLPSAEAMQADPNVAASAREQLRNRAMGLVAGTVGTWDALSAFGLGGPVAEHGGVYTQQPYGAPPGTLLQRDIQQTPLAGIPYQQPGAPGAPSPTGAAPAAVAVPPGVVVPPAAAPAAPNALQPPAPLPPPDTYQPGQVQATPLGPLAPAPAPAPAASPAAQAPAAVVSTPPAASVSSAGGGPPPRNMSPGYTPGSSAAAPAARAPAAPAAAAAPAAPASGPGVSQYQQTPQGVPIAISDGKPLWQGDLRGGSPPPPAHTSMGAPLWQQYQGQVDDAQKKFETVSAQEGASQRLLAQTTQVRDAYNTLQRSRLTVPGPGLPARMEAVRSWNQLMGTVGGPQIHTTGEAAYTELQKTSTTMGFAALSQYFGLSREAQATVQSSLAAVPGVTNTFLGGQLVNRMIEAFAQRASDQYRFENQYMQENYGSAINADIRFQQQHPITDTVNGVLKEFGLGANGFTGATRAETANNLRTAYRAGYITKEQFHDLWNGQAARAMQ